MHGHSVKTPEVVFTVVSEILLLILCVVGPSFVRSPSRLVSLILDDL